MIKKGPTARQISQCPELLKRIRELEAEVERLRQERHLTACELDGLEGYDTDDGVYEAVKVLRDDLARVTEKRDLYRDLLVEARETHDYDYERDPWAGEADECPCQWCDDVRDALEADDE